MDAIRVNLVLGLHHLKQMNLPKNEIKQGLLSINCIGNSLVAFVKSSLVKIFCITQKKLKKIP